MPINTAATLEKWKRNAGNAAEEIKRGVQSVTVSPTQQAAQAVDKYARGVQEAVSSGKFVANCNKVTVGDWQSAMLGKGLRNYSTGVSNISPAKAKAMADQQQYAEQVRQEIQSMPNLTEADAENRALAAIRKMREYGRR